MCIRRLLQVLAVFTLLIPVFSVPVQANDFSRHTSYIRFNSHLYNNHHTNSLRHSFHSPSSNFRYGPVTSFRNSYGPVTSFSNSYGPVTSLRFGNHFRKNQRTVRTHSPNTNNHHLDNKRSSNCFGNCLDAAASQHHDNRSYQHGYRDGYRAARRYSRY